jgi:hypothetical protein
MVKQFLVRLYFSRCRTSNYGSPSSTNRRLTPQKKNTTRVQNIQYNSKKIYPYIPFYFLLTPSIIQFMHNLRDNISSTRHAHSHQHDQFHLTHQTIDFMTCTIIDTIYYLLKKIFMSKTKSQGKNNKQK